MLLGCDTSSPVINPASAQQGPIAIVGAFPLETQFLESQMTAQSVVEVQGRRFVLGTLEGHSVVVGTLGVGTINSGSGASLLIERFRPRKVILSGVAGGIGDAKTGDVVVGRQIINYGFGQLNGQGYAPWQTYQPDFVTRNPLFFESDETLVSQALQVGASLQFNSVVINGATRQPIVREGIIATEDVFSEVATRNQQVSLETGCNAFEEEGAAVAQTCFQLNIPFLILRGISNPAQENGFAIFEQFSAQAAENANRVVIELLKNQ